MIRAIIIDDESTIRKMVREKISLFFKDKITIIAETSNVKGGIVMINNYQPDILFLDVELTDGTSFDILNEVTYHNYQIIFITGFSEHAIKAIKVGALDYILKPIDNDEFVEATNKAITELDKNKNIKNFINVSSDFFKGNKNKRIVLKTLSTHHIVNENDILYCKSEGMYTTFYLKNDLEVMISKPLKVAEELLSKSIFLKCHQSYIVNKDYVVKYITEGFLILKNDRKIPIAHRRKEFVLNSID